MLRLLLGRPLRRQITCPRCKGFGRLVNGNLCTLCRGYGFIVVPDDPP